MAEYRKILTCVCLALQFIVLGLLVYSVVQELAPEGTSLSMSLWQPSVSGSSAAQRLSAQRLGCGSVDNIVKAAAAFAIISIVLTLGSLVLTVLNITGVLKVSNRILLLLCIIASFTTLASCACLLVAKNEKCDDLQDEMRDPKGDLTELLTSVLCWVIEAAICAIMGYFF